MSGGLVSPQLYGEIRETILAVRGKRRVSHESVDDPQRRQPSAFTDHAVILDAALAAATNAKTGATSALATVCKWSMTDEEYVETTLQLTVWNHSESKSYEINTIGIAKFLDGHWWFLGDCAGMASR